MLAPKKHCPLSGFSLGEMQKGRWRKIERDRADTT